MTDWYRGERTVRMVEYAVRARVPWGACWNQVQQALSAAVKEYEELFGNVPPDDAVRVAWREDEEEIIISFDVSGLRGC